MKKLATKTTCLLLLLTVAFASCQKESIEPGKPSGGNNSDRPEPFAQYLQITMNEFLPASKIDSALVIWEVNGVSQTEKLSLVGNLFRLSLATLNNNGNGSLTIQLFSQLKVDGKPLQWEYRSPYTLNRTEAVTVVAPVDMRDPSWNPRVIFHYDNGRGGRFSALIALRSEDAYFELKGVEPVYARRIEIVRSYHKKETGTLVFSRGWVGQHTSLDNSGNLTDRQHFSNLREQLIDKEWNQYRIRASFYLNSNPNMTYEFNLEQDRW